MPILGMGLDFQGRPLFSPVKDEDFRHRLLTALDHNGERLLNIVRTTSEGARFRAEVERRAVDSGDPRSVGWTFLINAEDPARAAISAALAPLAKLRGMGKPNQPLLYSGAEPGDWFDWLHDNFYALALDGEKPPGYILIIGGPSRVPFLFQSLLATVANVGRLDFDDVSELENYVKKVIRLETAANPVVARDVVLFAPDGGPDDPTFFSRHYMVEPLSDHVTKLGFPTRTIVGDAATKGGLINALRGTSPALVYTASHGLGATSETSVIQKRYNGAICCQHAGPLTLESIFSADDVPLGEPFLEGSVFFQFACFGYGTPAESDYAHWLDGMPERYTDADFVAALPKRLLAHPRGPIAFIGHVDTAFLHGFAEANAPHTLARWHNRVEPFVRAVDCLLNETQPSGHAMKDMSTRYSICNARLTDTYDRQRRGRWKWTEDLVERFLDTWITRSDAQNYMVFGDPAVRLRIPSAD